jgi:hypothetical protein
VGKLKRQSLQAAWDIALGDLRRRRPELADLESHRRAFKNAAAQIVARADVRGLAALPSNSASDEARVLAVRTAKAALAFHPEWRDETHSDCALAGSIAALALLQGDGLSVAELQRQVDYRRIGGCRSASISVARTKRTSCAGSLRNGRDGGPRRAATASHGRAGHVRGSASTERLSASTMFGASNATRSTGPAANASIVNSPAPAARAYKGHPHGLGPMGRRAAEGRRPPLCRRTPVGALHGSGASLMNGQDAIANAVAQGVMSGVIQLAIAAAVVAAFIMHPALGFALIVGAILFGVAWLALALIWAAIRWIGGLVGPLLGDLLLFLIIAVPAVLCLMGFIDALTRAEARAMFVFGAMTFAFGLTALAVWRFLRRPRVKEPRPYPVAFLAGRAVRWAQRRATKEITR